MKNQVNNFENVNGWNIHYDDITSALFEMYINSFCDSEEEFEETIKDKEELRRQIDEGIFDLHTTCQNSYNRDSFRMLYQVLANITETHNERKDYIPYVLEHLLPYCKHNTKKELEDCLLYDPLSIVSHLLEIIEEKGDK